MGEAALRAEHLDRPLQSLVQRVFTAMLAHEARAFRASPLSARMLDKIRADTRGQDPAALFCLFNGISSLEIGHRLREIRVPCHVFAGTHDPVVPPVQSLLIAGEVPGANTVVFRNVGHIPFMEDTEAYFSALERVLADITDRITGRMSAPSNAAEHAGEEP